MIKCCKCEEVFVENDTKDAENHLELKPLIKVIERENRDGLMTYYNETQFFKLGLELIDGMDEVIDACPNCLTDSYLMDLDS